MSLFMKYIPRPQTAWKECFKVVITLLKFIPDQYKIQELCEKAILK